MQPQACRADLVDRGRLELEVLADNEHALALYRRFGFKPESLRRDVVFRAGIYADTLAMARLRR